MKRLNTILALAVSLLAFGALEPAFAGDTAPQMRIISYKQDSSDAVLKVQRALLRYEAACVAHDRQRISDSLTSFAVIEYATSAAGQFEARDALATEGCWSGLSALHDRSNGGPVIVYPTSESNSVLIQYPLRTGKSVGARSVQDIALVQLDGERIARIRDYLASAPHGDIGKHGAKTLSAQSRALRASGVCPQLTANARRIE